MQDCSQLTHQTKLHLWFRAVQALAMKNLSRFTKNRKPGFSTSAQNDIRQSVRWKESEFFGVSSKIGGQRSTFGELETLTGPGSAVFFTFDDSCITCE